MSEKDTLIDRILEMLENLKIEEECKLDGYVEAIDDISTYLDDIRGDCPAKPV